MHGAGPRRGFAPDDARAGTGGGGRAPTRFRRDAENMHTTIFGPGTPRGPRERFPCFLCRHRQAALCSVRRGAALCHLVVAPSGSPGPLGPPALGREGEGKFRGAGGCVGLVSSRRTGQSGACLGRCSHSHGAWRSAHGLLPASRKSRGGSPSLQKAQGPEHRGAHQGGTPRVVGGERVSGRGRWGGRASHPVLAAHGGPAAPGRAHGTAAARPRRPGGPRRAELALSFGDSHRRLWHERWDGSGFWRTWAKSCASRPLTCRRKTARALSPSEWGEVTAPWEPAFRAWPRFRQRPRWRGLSARKGQT